MHLRAAKLIGGGGEMSAEAKVVRSPEQWTEPWAKDFDETAEEMEEKEEEEESGAKRRRKKKRVTR